MAMLLMYSRNHNIESLFGDVLLQQSALQQQCFRLQNRHPHRHLPLRKHIWHKHSDRQLGHGHGDGVASDYRSGAARQESALVSIAILGTERQAEEVDRVKRSESGMIVDPITIAPEKSISDALELMKRYRISGSSGQPATANWSVFSPIRDLRF